MDIVDLSYGMSCRFVISFFSELCVLCVKYLNLLKTFRAVIERVRQGHNDRNIQPQSPILANLYLSLCMDFKLSNFGTEKVSRNPADNILSSPDLGHGNGNRSVILEIISA